MNDLIYHAMMLQISYGIIVSVLGVSEGYYNILVLKITRSNEGKLKMHFRFITVETTLLKLVCARKK